MAEFGWTSGELVSYLYWSDGEPNNYRESIYTNSSETVRRNAGTLEHSMMSWASKTRVSW